MAKPWHRRWDEGAICIRTGWRAQPLLQRLTSTLRRHCHSWLLQHLVTAPMLQTWVLPFPTVLRDFLGLAKQLLFARKFASPPDSSVPSVPSQDLGRVVRSGQKVQAIPNSRSTGVSSVETNKPMLSLIVLANFTSCARC